MILPGGWTPDKGLPSGVSISDAFLGSAADRAEVEEVLNITLSSDDSLWKGDNNEFSKYVDPDENWVMTAFDRVVLLGTFLQLKAADGLSAEWKQPDYYEEYVELPLFGRTIFNRWVVHGYVSPTQRVCRSTEGNNYGKWALVTLEPDASDSVLKQRWESQDGTMCELTFEKQGK